MTVRSHFIFWTFVFTAFLALVWLFKGVLLPFALGAVVAYLLNPLVQHLGKIKIGRGPAALLILTLFLAAIVSVFAALAPVLYNELRQLSEDLPGYIDRLWELAEPFAEKLQSYADQGGTEEAKALLKNNAGTAVNVAVQLLGGLAVGGRAVIDMISLLVIMPIVAFFMMKDWPRMTDWVCSLIPRHSEKEIMELFRQIDRKLSAFIRGQVSVALILATAYATALSLAGLKYGFLIGVSAGLLSVIPMVGSTLGLLAGIAVAWFQSGEWTFVAIVAGIFLVGQVIEGNFLTPKIVGNSIGLHPLWIFFALLAGGSLFGFLGLLIAVPVAAIISVLVAFAIKQYKNSPYYKGKKNG
jgi:predicted PurR-regulated permease PerM